jgi:hypothetical protein
MSPERLQVPLYEGIRQASGLTHSHVLGKARKRKRVLDRNVDGVPGVALPSHHLDEIVPTRRQQAGAQPAQKRLPPEVQLDCYRPCENAES